MVYARKMQVPSDRMDAAQIVFHLSVLSMMINVTQVPYNASIISHERMDVYAYVEMANVGLKLLIVYLLQIGNFDKLVLYAVLVFLVSAFIALFYRVYCVRNFQSVMCIGCGGRTYSRKCLLSQVGTFMAT